MEGNVYDIPNPEMDDFIKREISSIKFTKNFRSSTAEEWYMFLKSYRDPVSKGAAGKVIVHYNLFGNRDVFINTTIIFDDPALYKHECHKLICAVADETINRLVGYADTLLSVHAGENSYQAEYVERDA